MGEHKRGAAAAATVFLLAIAITVLPTLSGSSAGALTDSTTCSQWAAATPGQQSGYAYLYLREYRPAPVTAANAQAVGGAISKACVEAAYLGEADDVSVVAAFRHAF